MRHDRRLSLQSEQDLAVGESMSGRSVLVLGAGVAGLATAVLLGRDGHRVTVVDRDDVPTTDDATTATTWPRSGVPHFHQPHAFIPRGRSELREHLPDVYHALLGAGAWVVDTRAKLGGLATDADEELQYLAVRRPLIEWALRRAALACPNVDVYASTRVDGLVVDGRLVAGARIDGRAVASDVVVDALGRRTSTSAWLSDSLATIEPATSSDCGVVYYSRYYQCRPGFQLPDGPWFLSPRGDLGYLGYSTFPGDNGTFAVLFAVPAGVTEWKLLHDVAAFEAAVALVPVLASWVDLDGVDAITPVMAMAGLRNSLRPIARDALLFPVGDAYGHTDPVLAHGLAFGLIHAGELARVLREHENLSEAFDDYAMTTAPALHERYAYATELDEQRHRMWVGGDVDFAHHDADYALFTVMAGGVAAAIDPDLARVCLRRLGLLDSTRVLDEDLSARRRIEATFAAASAVPRPRQGPSREELLEVIERASNR